MQRPGGFRVSGFSLGAFNLDAVELAKSLVQLAPSALYLAGVIYLYRRNESQTASYLLKLEQHTLLYLEKMEKLLDRYHTLVVENVKAFQTISDELKDK
jgi:hypothetical protein